MCAFTAIVNVFFFSSRRRHTRFDCDWSSDVCSSDLKNTASTTNAWVWQKPDPAQVAASMPVIPAALPNGEQPNGRLLRPILAQIENLKGGGVEGQLLVYQVFLRVPYQLLHDEGIKALHLVDERTVIQNPVLYAAIVKAAKDVTGVELA